MPSNTEILYALGLGDKIVGVSDFCNYPPEAKKKEKIGGVILNLEKIISLKPDLIVSLEDAQINEINKLRKRNLPVLSLNPRNIQEVLDSIAVIGKATGKEDNANQITKQLQKRIAQAKINLSVKPKVFVVINVQPLITAGAGTFIDDLINTAGGENLGAQAKGKYPEYGREALLHDNPQVLIIPEDIWTKNTKSLSVLSKNRKILVINADLISRPGPRLVDGLEAIHNFLKSVAP